MSPGISGANRSVDGAGEDHVRRQRLRVKAFLSKYCIAPGRIHTAPRKKKKKMRTLSLLSLALAFGTHLFSRAGAAAPPPPPVLERSSAGEASAEARQGAADCVAKSQNVTRMTLEAWNIWHAPSANAHLRSTFTIFNPGPEARYKMQGMPFIEDGEWHGCESLPAQLSGCQYQSDSNIGGVGFQLLWTCAGEVGSKQS